MKTTLILLPLFLAICLLVPARVAHAAGVTIVTHGHQPFPFPPRTGEPEWVLSMAAEIVNRAGNINTEVSLYRAVVEYGGGQLVLSSFARIAGPAPKDAPSGEVVIVLDWREAAAAIEPFITPTPSVAATFFPILTNVSLSSDITGPLAQLPIHLIGHSRGGSVVTEVARLLGREGIWVDQVTLLDPHPVDGVNDGGFNYQDSPIQLWSNIRFADNYWRADGAPIVDLLDVDGEFVAGAYDGNLLPVIYSGQEHVQVHAYYHGTIRLNAASDYLPGGSEDGTPILGSWYPGTTALPSRDRTGFYYSRMGGGTRPASGVGAYFGGSGARTTVARLASSWPNIAEPVLQRVGNTITIGETVLIQSVYQTEYSLNTNTYFLDTDRNPYNGVSRNIRINYPGTANNTTGRDDFNWNTSGQSQGTYYLGAKIFAGGKTRYAYATTPIVLTAANEQVGTAITAMTTTWEDDTSGGDGDGRIEGGETVRLKVRLTSSASISQVTGTLYSRVPNIQITDSEIDFPSFTPGQSQYGSGSFDLVLNLTSYAGALFVVDVRYVQSGLPYRQTFQFTKDILTPADAAFVVQSVRVEDTTARYGGNNNDGAIQSGESVRIYPRLRNSGVAAATGIDAWIEYSHPAIEILDAGEANAESYPDLSSGSDAEPSNGSSFSLRVWDRTFSGTIYADMVIKWDQIATPLRLTNGLRIDIAPAPWLSFNPKSHDFGVVKPGTNVIYTLNLMNGGSSALQITGLTPSQGDTVVSGVSLPLTLNSGQSQNVTVTINTTGLQGSINRTVTVASNGRTANPGQDNVLTIAGLVSDSAPIFQIPSTTIVDDTHSVDISGHSFVWMDSELGGIDIRAYNASESTMTWVCTNAANQSLPRIHSNIVAWVDFRNNALGDIYGYNLSTKAEFIVTTNAALERLIGVDNGKIAYVRHDFTFQSYSDQIAGYNIYLFDVQSGTTTKLTDYSTPTAGSPSYSAPSSLPNMDMSDGFIAWREGRRNWVSAPSGWDSTEFGGIAKIQVGVDSSKVVVPGIHEGVFVQSGGGRIVWVKSDGNNTDQIWSWKNGSSSQVTTEDRNHGQDILAVGTNHMIYDKRSRNGIYYYDFQATTEKLLTSDPSRVGSGRMDRNGVVWIAYSPVRILYAYIDQPDLAVTSGDLTLSKTIAVEGENLTLTATARNITDFAYSGGGVARLYRGDPDQGGTQIGQDAALPGTIAAKGATNVTFAFAASQEGTNRLFVKLFPSGQETPGNNKASIDLVVLDSDVSGPAISNFTVIESNGDGDGIIGSDEQFRVSWQLSDASGIGSVQLLIDGVLTVHTQTSGTYAATVGPLAAGPHQVEIRATDADASPASSTNVFVVNVVRAENIALTYGGLRLTNSGSAVNLGTFTVGGSEPRLFTVQNLGEQNLFITALTSTGAIASASLGTTNVTPGGLTALTITPSALSVGVFTAQVIITNSDPLGTTFRLPITWQVQGQSPSILSQPGNVTAPLGSRALLSVSATGTQPLAYQWSKGGTNLVNDGRISGVTSATLSITNLQASDAGSYLVTVTNAFGSTNSLSATLVVSSTGTLQFSSASYTVTEGSNTTAVLTVTRTGGSSGAVSVSYATANGTATAGSDYTAASSTLSWANGDTANKTITVPILNDSTPESNESFTVTLTSATGGATLGATSTAAVTILNDDNAPPPDLIQITFATFNDGVNPTNPAYDVDGVTKLDSGFRGQLYVGSVSNPSSLVAIGTPQPFLNGAGAGYINAATVSASIAGLVPGASGYYQLRVWHSADGSSYELARLVNPQARTGTSTVSPIVFGGGLIPPPLANTHPAFSLRYDFLSVAILSHPTNQTVAVGSNATFVVIAGGPGTLSYQWRKDGKNVSGATNATFILTNCQTNHAGTYSAVVASSIPEAGSRVSSNAVLTVNPPTLSGAFQINFVTANGPQSNPVFDLDGTTRLGSSYYGQLYAGPTAQSLFAIGTPAAFLDGAGAGFIASGAITGSGIAGLYGGATGVYQLRVWNSAAGSTFEAAAASGSGRIGLSQIMNITFGGSDPLGGPPRIPPDANLHSSFSVALGTPPPSITSQPSGGTAPPGTNLTLSVSASGWGALTYQWWRNGAPLADGPRVSGALTRNLTILNARRSDSGKYSVIVANAGGSVTSSNAVVRVLASTILDNPKRNAAGNLLIEFGDGQGETLTSSHLPVFEVQFSTNFTNWMTATNGMILTTNGMIRIEVPPTGVRGFYRVIER